MCAPDPGAFEAVVLGDRTTWYRATFQEWINMLVHLKRRQQQLAQEHQGEPAPGPAASDRKVDGTAAPPSPGAHTPAKGRRKEGVKYPDPIGMRAQLSVDGECLTAWELRFLHVSKDIGEAHAMSRTHGPMNIVSLLVEWLLAVEKDTAVAESRRERRARDRDAITFSSSRRLKNRKLPYYPGAVELAPIALVCQIVVERIVMDYAEFSSESTERTRPQIAGAGSIDSFFASAEGRSEIINLFADLRLRGYRTACNEEECLIWMKAHVHLFARTWRLTRDLLAYIFGATASTVRKDLSPKHLNDLYAENRIDPSQRIHHDRTMLVTVAHLYRQGWSQRLFRGHPDPRDEGTEYVLTKKAQ